MIFKDQEYTFLDGARRDLIIHNETDLDDPADITHAYAIGWVKDASMPIIELWRVTKITKHRDKYNKVGTKHYSYRDWEMYARKVPLLQVLKYMPCSIEVSNAIAISNAAESGRGATIENGIVIDMDEQPTTSSPAGNVDKSTGEIFDTKTTAVVDPDDQALKQVEQAQPAGSFQPTDAEIAAIHAREMAEAGQGEQADPDARPPRTWRHERRGNDQGGKLLGRRKSSGQAQADEVPPLLTISPDGSKSREAGSGSGSEYPTNLPTTKGSTMKKNRFAIAAILTAVAILITACGKSPVSPDRLEEGRQTAKTNAEMNAQLYRAANPRFTGDYSIVARSERRPNAGMPAGRWLGAGLDHEG